MIHTLNSFMSVVFYPIAVCVKVLPGELANFLVRVAMIYNYEPVSIKVKDFLEGADNDSVDARME